jgi:F-type H+-transporting ATPase subunit beta
VLLSGLSIAEYFHDGAGSDQGKETYFSLWIIFSVLQSDSEVSALLGRILPSAVGYQ